MEDENGTYGQWWARPQGCRSCLISAIYQTHPCRCRGGDGRGESECMREEDHLDGFPFTEKHSSFINAKNFIRQPTDLMFIKSCHNAKYDPHMMGFVGMLHVSDDKRTIKIFIQIHLLCSETRHKSKNAKQIHVVSSEKTATDSQPWVMQHIEVFSLLWCSKCFHLNSCLPTHKYKSL